MAFQRTFCLVAASHFHLGVLSCRTLGLGDRSGAVGGRQGIKEKGDRNEAGKGIWEGAREAE